MSSAGRIGDDGGANPNDNDRVMHRATELARGCIGAWLADRSHGVPGFPLLVMVGSQTANEMSGDPELFRYTLLAFGLLAGGAIERAARAENRPVEDVFQEVSIEFERRAVGRPLD